MGELFGSIGKLLGIAGQNGAPAGLSDILGSDVFKNLFAGGMALNNSMQTNDLMDFQKKLATNADTRAQTLFNQDQEDRDSLKRLDFF